MTGVKCVGLFGFGRRERKKKVEDLVPIEEDEITDETNDDTFDETSPPQELMVSGEIQEPILINYQKYIDESVNPEFRQLARLSVSPGVLLGVASGTEIALLIGKLYLGRTRFIAGPQGLRTDVVLEYDIFVDAARIIANVSRKGVLLEAETRYPISSIYGGGRR